MKKLLLYLALISTCLLNELTAQSLFSSVSPDVSGIKFQNKVIETPALNIITYEYYYNGGGVATGDFNNDGLTDIFFTANLLPNALYLNKGNWMFEDITKSAAVEGRRGWKTGVTVADVNGDGWLDIYVCYSGDVEPKSRKNQLFINNKDLSFTEKAESFGIADAGYTTHAVFFDIDRDNDLDLFVLNHNTKSLRNFDASFVKKMIDEGAGDRLYRNDGNKFVDITVNAGIISNPLGYGLSAIVSDVNNDGWQDLYVTNDYVEEDYLYINNQNGTFTESLKQQIGHISNFSMGADIADINNDGWMDIFTLDMLPADNKRQKLLYAPDNYELYNNQVQNGFHHQLMRNMLQLNNGNNSFSEIGQLSGVSNTDWSWAALFADFDNDGLKDLFVTNGYGRDMINRDFVKFYANERLKFLQGKPSERMFQMLQGIKTTPTHNYFFSNKDNLQFKDRSIEEGFAEENLSHGAAYADFDNDGDLDLVVNNLNATASLYRNNLNSERPGEHYLQIDLRMPGNNAFAIGAKITVYTPKGIFSQENNPVHGFQSAMQGPVHIGLPSAKIDSLIIVWPDGTKQRVQNQQINKRTAISYEPAGKFLETTPAEFIFRSSSTAISFQHQTEPINDFKIQPLMPNMINGAGPRMAKADINKDGLDDLYICGGRGQEGKLLLQQKDGSFKNKSVGTESINGEETAALFFDADSDGDMDLYIVAGNYAAEAGDKVSQDRLYINSNGNFQLKPGALPTLMNSRSCVVAEDFDADGDKDLFVGARVIPGQYPVAPGSYLLINNGKGTFTNATESFAPSLLKAGMITDAVAIDINNDKKQDLIICGEWMNLQVLINNGKQLELAPNVFDDVYKGWWNRLTLADIDLDGDMDLIAGNWGTNSQIRATKQQPAALYYKDFDQNGSVDPLLTYYVQGKSYPMASRDELTDQVVSWRQKYPTYDSYSNVTIDDILGAELKAASDSLHANFFETAWWENKEGKLILHHLPVQANYSPVHAIAIDDFNADGKPDILLGGNMLEARLKIGRMDANQGVLLIGDGKGNFNYVPQYKSGLNITGEVREILQLKIAGRKTVAFGITNALPQLFNY